VLRADPAEPIADPVQALRALAAEVLARTNAQLEAGGAGALVDQATRLLTELARIDGRYIERSAVLSMEIGSDVNLDAEIEARLGNLISKPTQARLNTLYDALDAEADGQDVDEAVLKGAEVRRKVPASLLKTSFTGTSLDDVPGVAVEAYVIDHRPLDEPEPEPPNGVTLGKGLPPGFGTRRSSPASG
jgi:hypothetical protein